MNSTYKNRDGKGQGPVQTYWRDNLRLMAWLLSIWFVVSYLLSIILVEPLNQFHLGGFPLGFWFAHQGSIFVFVVLVFVYARWMDRIDTHHGMDTGNNSSPASTLQKTAE